MANFNTAKPIIAALEGGLSKNPNDNAANDPAPNSGGYHTNKGVTWATFRDSAKQFGYSPTTELFLKMPQTIVDSIAKTNYWDKLRLDSVNSNKKAYLAFDFAFNSGPVTAIKFIQKAIGISIDGIAGLQFVSAINAMDETTFSQKITAERVAFIRSSGKIQESVKPGLISRIESLLKKKFPTV
jgi:lysozyme family protein